MKGIKISKITKIFLDKDNKENNLKKKIFKLLLIFILVIVCLIGVMYFYKDFENKNIEKSEKEINNLKQQIVIYCNTQKTKNQQKCQDLTDKLKIKSMDLCVKISTDLETCLYMGKVVKEIKNLEKEINAKCDNEFIGNLDDLECKNLKNDFYSSIKSVCKNDKINVKVCKEFIDFAGEKRNKILQNMSYFRQLACEYGNLDGCYKLAIAFGNTDNLQEAKKILQSNCQKSHQQSCDKLKELK